MAAVGVDHEGPGTAGVGIKAGVGQQKRLAAVAQLQAQVQALADLQRRRVGIEGQLGAETAVLDLRVDAGHMQCVVASLVRQLRGQSFTHAAEVELVQAQLQLEAAQAVQPRDARAAAHALADLQRQPGHAAGHGCAYGQALAGGAHRIQPLVEVRHGSLHGLYRLLAHGQLLAAVGLLLSEQPFGQRQLVRRVLQRRRRQKAGSGQLAVAPVQAAHPLQLELVLRQCAALRGLGLHPRGAQGREVGELLGCLAGARHQLLRALAAVQHDQQLSRLDTLTVLHQHLLDAAVLGRIEQHRLQRLRGRAADDDIAKRPGPRGGNLEFGARHGHATRPVACEQASHHGTHRHGQHQVPTSRRWRHTAVHRRAGGHHRTHPLSACSGRSASAARRWRATARAVTAVSSAVAASNTHSEAGPTGARSAKPAR
mmetsp:Transcript_9917/g.23242  ORF Transcript_9917/g.23242 Transcript_9917/m.23242 type:complete len:427 (+) Transcript_9917:586-1866(+)